MWTIFFAGIAMGMGSVVPGDQVAPDIEIETPEQSGHEVNDAFFPIGSCMAGTKIQDHLAPGGFASSDNMPRDIDFGHALKADSIHLILEKDAVEESNGYRVRLINTSGQVVPFSAVDGRLLIIQQALDSEGKWRNVEMLPSSGCGNSYHRVMLDRNQYWQFDVPRYGGSDQTQIRYTLVIRGQARLISNAIEGRIDQLKLLPFPLVDHLIDPVRHMPVPEFIEVSKQN